MATTDIITGARAGNSTSPWLTLKWEQIQKDITNNRSLVRLTLYLHSSHTLNFSGSRTGVLNGTSFTYTGGFSGTGTKVLKTIDVWVSHGQDGKLSQWFEATFDINVSWGGTQIRNMYVGGYANPDPIPRASTFSHFSLTNSSLYPDWSTTLNYTIDRKSPSYTQELTLKLGTKVIKTWNTPDTGGLYISLEASEVAEIISNTPNSTSGTLTLYMQTKNGSTNIGSPATITTTFTIDPLVKPFVTNLSLYIYGAGRDNTIGKYVQGISRVGALFDSFPGYGATISLNKITVKRKVDNANIQVISGKYGHTPNPLTLSGVYIVTAEAKDSRGRVETLSEEIEVLAYSPPKITRFTATRRQSPNTTVDASFRVEWTGLDGLNRGSAMIYGIDNLGNRVLRYHQPYITADFIDTVRTFTSQLNTSAYAYELTVEDEMGNLAMSTTTVGTSFVELSISKGKGVGIGKIHERGALDVKGDSYVEGNTYLEGDVHIEGNLILPNELTPAGVMSIFAGANAPEGYLICNGQAVSRSNYSKLYEAIGTTYGSGDGYSTFNLPDMRGRVPVGRNSGDGDFGNLGSKGGSKTHTLTESEMPRHRHSITELASGTLTSTEFAKANQGGNYTRPVNSGFTGGGLAHNNLQPFITLNFIIKF